MRVSIVSFSGNTVTKSREQIENEQLLNLYREYKKNPFDYAIINYRKDKEPKVQIFRETTPFFKKIVNKLFKMIKK